MSPLDFGPTLRARRLSAGLTQERLAELAEITPIYVSELERGRYSPSLAVVDAWPAPSGCVSASSWRPLRRTRGPAAEPSPSVPTVALLRNVLSRRLHPRPTSRLTRLTDLT
jgi:hypothetical protein